MQLLDLTLPTAAENLALDEALLESVDDQPAAAELLRLWECPQRAVVLGRSGKVAEEVFESRSREVPILRRTSGGGTVLLGPGCLMYSLRLSYERRPHLRALDQAHHEVLSTIAAALNNVLPGANIQPRGTSDLAIGERKFSGNSLRCKRNFLLYHGTLLYDFDLSRIESLLRPPPRQPDYREQRSHDDFVMNLPLPAAVLRQALIAAWRADDVERNWPRELTQRLLRERYEQAAWNFER